MAIPPIANSVGLVVLGVVLSFVSASFWRRKGQEEALLARVVELEKQQAVISQTVTPLSTAFQKMLIDQLTHYHTPEMDALLVKLGPPKTLTPTEELRLHVLLEERTRDMGDQISPSERNAALMLPMVMVRVAEEEALLHAQTPDWAIVAVPAQTPDGTVVPVPPSVRDAKTETAP